MEMEMDEMLFWNDFPPLLPLYEAFRSELKARYPDLRVKVSKTQISFYNRHLFAMVSPPIRRKKEWPKAFIMVTFGLPYRVESPRIAMSVEAYPNRWTHHVMLERVSDITPPLMAWIDEAYRFSQGKR